MVDFNKYSFVKFKRSLLKLYVLQKSLRSLRAGSLFSLLILVPLNQHIVSYGN